MNRVLFYDAYTHGFYGAQQYLLEILGGLHAVQPIVVGPQPGPLLDKANALGLETAVIPYPSTLNVYKKGLIQNGIAAKLQSSFHLISYNIKLRHFLHEKEVKLVYCNNLRSVLSIGWAAKLHRLPLVWYLQSMLNSRQGNAVALRLADQVITISDNVQQIFTDKQRKRYYRKIRTIYPGIDLEYFDTLLKPASEKPKPNNMPFVIGSVAALTPEKGQHILLESFQKLTKRLPQTNVELWLIGDTTRGQEEFYHELVNKSQQGQLEDRVKFWGWRNDIPALLSKMDLFVLPSFSEGVPKSILEAMAARLPVIGTNVGGVPELIRDKVTGLLVPARDVNALSDALVFMVCNRQQAQDMGFQGRKRVEAIFTSKLFAQGFDELFASML